MAPNVPVIFETDMSRAIVGLWCDNCAQPSRIQAPLITLTSEGVGDIGEVDVCVDCGGYGNE
jgi:hypothetical protein